MKKLAVIGVLSLLVLTGCSKNSGPKTTVCKKDTLADRIDFVSEGDRVITQTEYDPYSFDDLDITKEQAQDKEFMEEVRASYKEIYDAVISKGIDIAYEVDVDQKQVIFKIILDYTVADLDELAALEIVDDVVSEYISLEASVDGFTAEGYTCK